MFAGGTLSAFALFIFYFYRTNMKLDARQGRLEALVQERTVELQNSESRFRSVIENAADGTQGLIQSFSPAAEEIFGWSEEEVKGQNVKLLMPIPMQENHDSYLVDYHLTGKSTFIGFHREVTGLRKDGSEFP